MERNVIIRINNLIGTLVVTSEEMLPKVEEMLAKMVATAAATSCQDVPEGTEGISLPTEGG